MAVNICPICSGEIMKYRRFQKEAEASQVSVCQCCGVRLRRRSGRGLMVVGLVLALAGLAALATSPFTGLRVPPPGTVLLLVLACGGVLAVIHGLGRRLRGWVALDRTALGPRPSPLDPPGSPSK